VKSSNTAGRVESVGSCTSRGEYKYESMEVSDDESMEDPQATPTNRLFEICRGGSLLYPDELKLLLQHFHNAFTVQSADGMYPIHVACRNNAPYFVVSAVGKAWPELVRERGPSGAFPLHEACRCAKSLETIKLLIAEWPESIRDCGNEQFKDIRLPLHDALSNPTVSLDIIQFLVREWPESIKRPIEKNMMAIHWACTNGVSLPVIQFLAEQWPESVGMETEYGQLLHYACSHSGTSKETIEYLVDVWPESPRQINRNGYLPLHLACHSHWQNEEIIAFLIAKTQGAVHIDSQTILRQLLNSSNLRKASPALLKLLVETWPELINDILNVGGDRFAVEDALNNATVSLDIIQFLFRQWPESIKLPLKNMVAIHWARQDRVSLPVMQFLTEEWPESVPMNYSHGILGEQIEKLIELLAAHYPEALRILDPSTNSTPLHLACQEQASLAVLQLLVKAWPESVEIRDATGFLPLHHACMEVASDVGGKRSLEKIKYLVKVSRETRKMPGQFGMLPLHWACLDPIASTEVIRYLVELYPEAVKVKDNRGRLPLHLACVQKKTAAFETIECLVKAWPESVRVYCNDHGAVSRAVLRRFLHRLNHWEVVEYFDRKNVVSLDIMKENTPQGNCGCLALDLLCDAMYLLVSGDDKKLICMEHIQLLTDGMPPLHFACTYSTRSSTMKYLASKFPDELTRLHLGTLPFHCALRARAPSNVIDWWLKWYPEAARTATTDTGDLPLHCYLSYPPVPREQIRLLGDFPRLPYAAEAASSIEKTTIRRVRDYLLDLEEHLKASRLTRDPHIALPHVKKLIELHPDALVSANYMKLVPLHIAAMHDSSLEVFFYLACQAPETFNIMS